MRTNKQRTGDITLPKIWTQSPATHVKLRHTPAHQLCVIHSQHQPHHVASLGVECN
ncbi:hypothetical protein E2C01_064696 [Portunus trituberculatus]|uniref:Uncharacterized protein n=1 Tax=Portunus trituberculatus TaxID=210409 RepID=A0A5B7HMK1_PORTR|nr:hypothetical protein [Portunus trituberculatus]